MASIFFSYSHKDEDLRDKFEAHLSALKRQGLIETWHDRRILVGDDFDQNVRAELERAAVILLLVSPDFIASDYCYGVEVTRALERHERHEARVIPVILRPCDWQDLPFGKLLAAPKDGRPIRSWPDLDEAFLDVVQKIKAALPKHAPSATQRAPSASGALPSFEPRSSNLRLKKEFTEADRDRFLQDAFDYMAKFFKNSLAELKERNEGVETAFWQVDANSFTGVVYRHGKAVSRCKITLGNIMGHGIYYSANDMGSRNSYNESLHVEIEDHGLFLRSLGMSDMLRSKPRKLTFEGAAEFYWDILMRPLQGG